MSSFLCSDPSVGFSFPSLWKPKSLWWPVRPRAPTPLPWLLANSSHLSLLFVLKNAKHVLIARPVHLLSASASRPHLRTLLKGNHICVTCRCHPSLYFYSWHSTLLLFSTLTIMWCVICFAHFAFIILIIPSPHYSVSSIKTEFVCFVYQSIPTA